MSLTSPSSSAGVLSRSNLTVDRNFQGELIPRSLYATVIEGLPMQFAVRNGPRVRHGISLNIVS